MWQRTMLLGVAVVLGACGGARRQGDAVVPRDVVPEDGTAACERRLRCNAPECRCPEGHRCLLECPDCRADCVRDPPDAPSEPSPPPVDSDVDACRSGTPATCVAVVRDGRLPMAELVRSCSDGEGSGCPGLVALYSDPTFAGEPSATAPCTPEQERPTVRITEDGLLEAAGFPALSADGDQLVVFRDVTDLAATETSWLELRDTRRGALEERLSLLEAQDDPEGEWPAAGSPAFRRIERRVEQARRRLTRGEFRTLAQLAVPADADRCGPVIAVREGAAGRRRIVVRESGPGAVLWESEAEGSVGVPDCGPDGGAAMLDRADGWFDPAGDLLLVERLYVSLPDWCDNVIELDVGRRPSRAGAPR